MGANYVPSVGWFYSWLDFRADDVRRDFADLAELGLDHVRIFPVWPWIQPNRGFLRALHALGQAATAIGETDEAARCVQFLHDSDPTAAGAITG